MKFGVFSVSMPEYTPAEATKLAKEIGYDAMEWRVAAAPQEGEPEDYGRRYWTHNKCTIKENNILEDTLEARRACDEAGLEMWGISPALPLDKMEEFYDVVRAAGKVGVKMVRFGLIKFEPEKTGMDYPTHFEFMRQKLREAEPVLKENDVKLVIEMHHGTLTASASSAARMLEGFDPEYYGLIYDVGNQVYEGYEDYVKSFQLLGDYIAHVHLKNAAIIADGEDEYGAAKWRGVSVPLKKGQANIKKFFEAMATVGYDGTVSIEDFSNEAPTEEKLRDNLAYMKALLEATRK